ncbi:uncharacterized protein [Diadema antillarum]|uniref:uncharacterized protein n=1 Tax=Diadema antillarum TaxID=105358 RepID=UPI003A89EF81
MSVPGSMDNAALKAIAKNLETDDQIDELAFALGMTYADITRCHTANRLSGVVTTKGTLELLCEWRAEVPPEQQLSVMRQALTDARLLHLKGTVFRQAEQRLQKQQQIHSLDHQSQNSNCQTSESRSNNSPSSEMIDLETHFLDLGIRESLSQPIQVSDDAALVELTAETVPRPSQAPTHDQVLRGTVQGPQSNVVSGSAGMPCRDPLPVDPLEAPRINQAPLESIEVSRRDPAPPESSETPITTEAPLELNVSPMTNCAPPEFDEGPLTNPAPLESNEAPSTNPSPVESNDVPRTNKAPLEVNGAPRFNPAPLGSNEAPSTNPSPVESNEVPSSNEGPLELNGAPRFHPAPLGSNETPRTDHAPLVVIEEPGTNLATPEEEREAEFQECQFQSPSIDADQETITYPTGVSASSPEAFTPLNSINTPDTTVVPLKRDLSRADDGQGVPCPQHYRTTPPPSSVNITNNYQLVLNAYSYGTSPDNLFTPMPPPVVPHGLQKKLSVKLNQESLLGQDWTSLAEKLGLESCIEALKGRQDPTMDLFQAAHQNGKIESLKELAKLLEEMERQDCNREWYATTDADPGFTKPVLESLAARAADNKRKGKEILCALMLDEMTIRKQDTTALENLNALCRAIAETDAAFQPYEEHKDTTALENLNALCRAIAERDDALRPSEEHELSDHIKRLEVVSKRAPSEKPKASSGSSTEAKQYTFSKPEGAIAGDFSQNRLVLNPATEGVLHDRYETLSQEVQSLESAINSLKDQTNRLKRQYESTKSNPAANAHETLVEIHKLRNENRQNEIRLACKRSQLLLFAPEWFKTRLSNGHAVMASPEKGGSESGDSIREMGVSSDGGISSNSHVFQEYNFIKPTFCDQCKGLLKGIMRQGLRCKVCKSSIHHKCMDTVSACSGPASQEGRGGKKLFLRQMSVREIRNLPEKRKMLRRQKSSSDLDTRSLNEVKASIKEEPVDPIYRTIKCAASLSGSTADVSRRGSISSNVSASSPKRTPSRSAFQQSSGSGDGNFLMAPDSPSRRSGTPKSAPHSPSNGGEESRRKILQSYGKSMSFDTEPSHKTVTSGRRSEPPIPVETPPRHCSSASDVMSVRLTSTVPSRHRYSGRVISGSYNSCQDSSASPPPGREYICLYDFEGMLKDDLTLRAGQRVRVAEDEGSDWWKGDCEGRFGYFPAFCVTFLQPWERVMQVAHPFKASMEKKDGLTLRKDQVVIQMSPEDNGWVQVRTGRKSGYYPYQYLEMYEAVRTSKR